MTGFSKAKRGTSVHYLVDKSNRIAEVDESWDARTAEDSPAGAGPTSDKILGRALEDFLVGDVTKMFVRTALDSARRLGEVRRMPYRCDNQHTRRRFEMVISPLEDGHVKVEHVLIEALPRKARRPRATIASNAGWRCSQCLCVRLVGSTEWLPADIEPSALLATDVCASCARCLFEPVHVNSSE